MSRYTRAMEEIAMPETDRAALETLLRKELARGDVALASVAPVLTHLLAGPGQSLVSDAIVAHMRGMLGDMAQQLLQAQAVASGETGAKAIDAARVDGLANRLASSTVILSHAYALTVEGHYALELEANNNLDPVLSPLLQELIASDREDVAELAMAAMAAQARFIQTQRRMNLPLGELPTELFFQVTSVWRRFASDASPEVLAEAEAAMRAGHKEAESRLGLLSRLVASMNKAVLAALSVDHAGISLFASGLARSIRQPRELVVLSCHEGQVARLALSLRAAGLKPEDITRQILLIHPGISLPDRFSDLTQAQAQALLSGARGGQES